MGSGIGKNGDCEVHLGANWRLKTSSFLPFSKARSFIFNKLVASVVSKNNLFAFLLSSLPGRPFDLPPMRRLVPNPGREWQTIIGYHWRVGMSSENKWGEFGTGPGDLARAGGAATPRHSEISAYQGNAWEKFRAIFGRRTPRSLNTRAC